jgi:hypothetical protein
MHHVSSILTAEGPYDLTAIMAFAKFDYQVIAMMKQNTLNRLSLNVMMFPRYRLRSREHGGAYPWTGGS